MMEQTGRGMNPIYPHPQRTTGQSSPFASAQRRRTDQPSDDDRDADVDVEEDDMIYPTRLPTSSRRYITTADYVTPPSPPIVVMHRQSRTRPRASQLPAPVQEPGRLRRRPHWMAFIGVGMLVMLFLWSLLTVLMNWWQLTQDDWHYGRPRTFQIDAVVGHNDSTSNPTHFIALNWTRHVEIIEFPGGDTSKARIYNGPVLVGEGQDLTPVTLSFRDVNGDGKPDMLVNIGDSRIVWLNDTINGIAQFRPLKPGEQVHL